MTSVDLVPVTAEDEPAVRAWLDLENTALAFDRPYDPARCERQRRSVLSLPWPGLRTRIWLARAGTEAVGYAMLALPVLDNLDSVFAEVCVAPGHRRTGIGTALAEHLAAQARAAGRLRLWLSTEAGATPSAGPAFAAHLGARPVLAEQRSRLVLPAAEATLAALRSQAQRASAGYELVQWVGAAPDQHVADLAELNGRMSTDAPFGDLHIEPTRYDPARIRAREAVQRAAGMLSCTSGAVHVASGRLVAYTDIEVAATVPEHGWQIGTLVEPAHRGNRLGMLVKLANLGLACREQPALRMIDTMNADSNSHMLAINDAIGFRSLATWTDWELAIQDGG